MADKANSACPQAWRVAKSLSEKILAQGKNGVWSPACVASLLTIVRKGASGATCRELDMLLGDGDMFSERDPFGIELERNWGYDGYDASSATAAWLSRSASPSEAFLHECDKCSVHVSIDDLADPRVSQRVTDWIAEQTHGLLSPSIELSPVALACLVSALYMKDAWADPFDGESTKVETFHAKNGDVQAAFMRGERDCAVIVENGRVAFLLPLSSDAGVCFVLPSGEDDHIDDALGLFERLSQGEGEWEPVDLGIPRFECESTLSDVCSLLKAAGVSTATAMELTPMVGVEGTPTQIVHGAKFAVDENGVEAGAYTVMVAVAGLPPENPPEPRKITLDRPFYAALVSRTGVPLFVASVALPSVDVQER
ncbi:MULTISPECIES: serpin family protein [unclassified Collinsella]|uniref:serpin family protein n=1 Tax=unclassified Collinsella TaxID=2637548 RepID=UPI003F92EDEF